ncbi:MFS transporter [Nocardioides sp. NPDC051685]|uniref:MFS transporter n=1 Tax=Nocardioides sp. NPDC051685 TaxID=3364334 RepID=UPI00378CD9E8
MNRTTAPTPRSDELVRSVSRKFYGRILIMLCALMFFSITDRVSLSFAGPGGMNEELGLSATAFGFAAGIFFFGYVLFEIPSSAAMRRYGAKRWFPRIVITWGLAQTLMAFSANEIMLYALRVLLGVAEAGLTPCALAYIAYFLPQAKRAFAYSIYMFAGTVSIIVMGPISLALIPWGDSLGIDFAGWRILFLVAGILPIIAGIVAYYVLPDGPAQAKWLTPEERTFLAEIGAAEGSDAASHSFKAGLRSGRVWLLGIAYFFFPLGTYILVFFLPTVLTGWHESDPSINPSILSSLPYALAAIVAIAMGFSVSRLGKAGVHVAVALSIGLVGAIIVANVSDHAINYIGLCLVAIGALAPTATFFSIVSKVFAAAAGASALALVNSLGVISGFVGPYVTGFILDTAGTIAPVFVLVSAGFFAAGTVSVVMDVYGERRQRRLIGEIAEDTSGLGSRE